MNDDQTDDNKHDALGQMDEQMSDEASALGSMSEEVGDIDGMAKAMGLQNDDNGPKELGGEDDRLNNPSTEDDEEEAE